MSNAPEREANGMTCEGKPWIKHYGEAHPDPDERFVDSGGESVLLQQRKAK